jgi:hypothetical protein
VAEGNIRLAMSFRFEVSVSFVNDMGKFGSATVGLVPKAPGNGRGAGQALPRPSTDLRDG